MNTIIHLNTYPLAILPTIHHFMVPRTEFIILIDPLWEYKDFPYPPFRTPLERNQPTQAIEKTQKK